MWPGSYLICTARFFTSIVQSISDHTPHLWLLTQSAGLPHVSIDIQPTGWTDCLHDYTLILIFSDDSLK